MIDTRKLLREALVQEWRRHKPYILPVAVVATCFAVAAIIVQAVFV